MSPRYLTFPWRKRNLRKVPDWVSARIEGFADNEIVAACVKRISASEITAGTYTHLGIRWEGENVAFPESQVPNLRAGKYSHRSVRGYIVRRTDLPKITKTIPIEVPNFGDWAKGSHTINQERWVYRRDQVPPRDSHIGIELLEEEPGNERSFLFRFRVNEIMNKSSSGFQDALLFNLNLLQENIGAVDVFPANSSVEDYLSTIQVNWELLPPGERGRNIARILPEGTPAESESGRRLTERYDLLASLGPEQFVNGTGGFQRYFGAKFTDNLVVLDNMRPGNAIYVMLGDWRELSQRSRTELLNSGRNDFIRIRHIPGWENHLRQVIEEQR